MTSDIQIALELVLAQIYVFYDLRHIPQTYESDDPCLARVHAPPCEADRRIAALYHYHQHGKYHPMIQIIMKGKMSLPVDDLKLLHTVLAYRHEQIGERKCQRKNTRRLYPVGSGHYRHDKHGLGGIEHARRCVPDHIFSIIASAHLPVFPKVLSYDAFYT